MHWFTIASRIILVAIGGGLLGWYFGNSVLGAAIALLALALFWSYQMWRVETWLNSDDPPPVDMYGIWGDMVARIYRHQRESRGNQEQLQSMVDYLLESFASMRDGVVIVEPQGGIRWCNQAATGLLKLYYPEDTGQAITNLVRYPEFAEYLDVQDYDEPLELTTEGQGDLNLQITISQFAEGDRLMFIRDVTEKSRLEKMRRDFVGNVSHELRTPLTVITGYLDTFLDNAEQLPQGQQKPLKQMAHQAHRMENLLKDLLWLSRIENQEHRDKHELVDVEALMNEQLEEVSGALFQRRIEINAESRQRIMGDYRELYSALSNLVQNAIKYSDEDSVVTIAWTDTPRGPELSVEDEGIGIDGSHISRLTERFYRVDDSRSAETGGTGLGLAIVKHVANGHGATLQIRSVPGRGSKFTLAFPPQSAGGEFQRTG
jgi:two-component system phosphate regulon sensor histidine kinase PhoR